MYDIALWTYLVKDFGADTVLRDTDKECTQRYVGFLSTRPPDKGLIDVCSGCCEGKVVIQQYVLNLKQIMIESN